MAEKTKKSSFSGGIGFVLAAAGSAVGLGNIWRFPYLAAKDGGGLFLLVYVILVLTFGFSLLTTDIAIGRKTQKSSICAFTAIGKKWGFVGKLAFVVPALIMPYYSTIGGWILKYTVAMFGGTKNTAQDGYFTDFITSPIAPVLWALAFLVISAVIVYFGVEKGIERFSRIIMPGLLVLIAIISVFSLTLTHTDGAGVTRTGLQGLAVYVIPDFTGLTFGKLMGVLLDAMSQLFFSLSVAMGIMITYGSYVKKDVNLAKSVTQIEVFDTGVALLIGMMIIPAVFVFSGTEGMASGPSLMFVSLPKIFAEMGFIGTAVGILFFIMVTFAALTSSVSVLEAVVANLIELTGKNRKKVTVCATAVIACAAILVCLGYSVLYFEITLPNGSRGQILDIMDYISNSFLMPIVSFFTCIIIGWVVKPQWIIDEMECEGHKFTRKKLYAVMIKYIAPALMLLLFLQSIGVFGLLGL